MKKNIVALIFIVSFSCLVAHGQVNDCELTLRKAMEEFNAGHFYGLSTMLQPCIKNGFTSEQKQRAYLLLTQTYLLLDDPAAAEDSYLKLLKANPEFVTDDARDAIDVVYLSKKFTSSPIFSLYGKIGPNISPVRLIQENNFFGNHDNVNLRRKYFLKLGWQFSFGADLHFSDHLGLNASFQYMATSYQRKISHIFGRDTEEFTDKQNWLNIPISLKYSFINVKFRPFLYVGFSTNFLVGDKANGTFTDVYDERNSSTTVRMANSDFLYKRNSLNRAVFLGGGLKKKVGLNYLFVDLSYAFGLRNIVSNKNLDTDNTNSKNYLKSQEVVFVNGHVDDYLRIDNLSVSIGYVYPLYKPRKLKKARTKAVIRKIRRQKDKIHEN